MRRTRRGMSLIEVMIATMVLSFTVATLMAIWPTSAQMREKSGNVSRASALLTRKLEQLRLYKYDQLNYTSLQRAGVIDASTNGSTDPPFYFTNVDSVPSILPEGVGRIDITFPAPGLARIDVEITWGGIVSQGNQVTAATYIADKTPVVN